MNKLPLWLQFEIVLLSVILIMALVAFGAGAIMEKVKCDRLAQLNPLSPGQLSYIFEYDFRGGGCLVDTNPLVLPLNFTILH